MYSDIVFAAHKNNARKHTQSTNITIIICADIRTTYARKNGLAIFVKRLFYKRTSRCVGLGGGGGGGGGGG